MNESAKALATILLFLPILAFGQVTVRNANFIEKNATLVVIGTVKSSAENTAILTDVLSGEVLGTTEIQGNAFRFNIPFTGARLAPCAIEAASGDDSDKAEVRNAPDLCSHLVAELSGQIKAAFAPGALISASAGGNGFQSIADAQGLFTVEVAALHANSVITLKAMPDAAASGLAMAAVAGPISTFLGSSSGPESAGMSALSKNRNSMTLASQGDISIQSEHESDPEPTTDTTIDAITTARWVLMVNANDGEIESLEDLIEAEKSLPADQLLQLAAIVKLITEEPDFDIPEGHDDLLSFISDAEAVAQFVDEVTAADPDDNPLTQAQNEILDEVSLENVFVAGNIPSRYYRIPAAVPGFIARSGELLEFNGDGTGSMLFSFFTTGLLDQSFIWDVVDGDIVIVFDEAILSFPFLETVEDSAATEEQKQALLDDGIFQVTKRFSIPERHYVLISDGVTVDIALQAEAPEIVYDPITLSDGVTVIQIESVSGDIQSALVELRNGETLPSLPFVNSMLAGQRWSLMSVYDLDSIFGMLPEAINGDLLFFNPDGTGLAEVSGKELIWGIDADEDLVIEFDNGDVLTIRLLEQEDQAFGAMYIFDRPGEARAAKYDLAVPQDPEFVFTPAFLVNAEGEFWNGLINSWIFGLVDSSGNLLFGFNFGWSFADSVNGANQIFLFSGESTVREARPFNEWSVTVEGDATASLEWFGPCFGTGMDCHRRTWTPLVENSDGKIYLFEQAESFNIFLPPEDQDWIPHFPGRVNFWGRQPFPPADIVIE